MMAKRLISFAALLLTFVSGAWAESIPQALWCSDNHTLYFVYAEPVAPDSKHSGQTVDYVYSGSNFNNAIWSENSSICTSCTTVVFDSEFALARPTNCDFWFKGFVFLNNIQGIEYLNTSQVTSMRSMFAICAELTSLDLSHFNTAKVTDMQSMFQSCSGLTALDLSTFDTSKVTSMVQMFKGCGASTLTVASGWGKISSFSNRFDSFTPSTINLVMHNDGDNLGLLKEFYDLVSGKTVNVTLQGRTLYKNGEWNTICLPFNVTLAGSPFAEATLKELNASGSSFVEASGKLTLQFTEATSIVAGKPYLIKWASGTDIDNPVFTGVTITSTSPTPVVFSTNCNFVGQYSPFEITASNKNEILMLGSNHTLGYSNNTRTLHTMRAHFLIPTTSGARAMTSYVVDFDGETTALTLVNSEKRTVNSELYDLQGRMVSNPSKGLYIVNGKKVLRP